MAHVVARRELAALLEVRARRERGIVVPLGQGGEASWYCAAAQSTPSLSTGPGRRHAARKCSVPRESRTTVGLTSPSRSSRLQSCHKRSHNPLHGQPAPHVSSHAERRGSLEVALVAVGWAAVSTAGSALVGHLLEIVAKRRALREAVARGTGVAERRDVHATRNT